MAGFALTTFCGIFRIFQGPLWTSALHQILTGRRTVRIRVGGWNTSSVADDRWQELRPVEVRGRRHCSNSWPSCTSHCHSHRHRHCCHVKSPIICRPNSDRVHFDCWEILVLDFLCRRGSQLISTHSLRRYRGCCTFVCLSVAGYRCLCFFILVQTAPWHLKFTRIKKILV